MKWNFLYEITPPEPLTRWLPPPNPLSLYLQLNLLIPARTKFLGTPLLQIHDTHTHTQQQQQQQQQQHSEESRPLWSESRSFEGSRCFHLQGQAFRGEFLTLRSWETSTKFLSNDNPSPPSRHEYSSSPAWKTRISRQNSVSWWKVTQRAVVGKLLKELHKKNASTYTELKKVRFCFQKDLPVVPVLKPTTPVLTLTRPVYLKSVSINLLTPNDDYSCTAPLTSKCCILCTVLIQQI